MGLFFICKDYLSQKPCLEKEGMFWRDHGARRGEYEKFFTRKIFVPGKAYPLFRDISLFTLSSQTYPMLILDRFVRFWI